MGHVAFYQWIEEGEHDRQDFKETISSSRKIAKTLCAFANTRGGRLLVGVRDNGSLRHLDTEAEKQMLENAHIGTPPASADGKVGAGMVVTAIIAGDEMKFLLGSREISSGDLDVYSEKSPLGSAVLNQEIGAKVSYVAPNGREISVEILAAEFYA